MRLASISRFATLVAVWSIAVLVADAQHHSYAADYDRNQLISLTGKVTKIEYAYPRVWLYINTEKADGVTESWTLEVLSTSHRLQTNGWTKDSLKAGDEVSVRGWKAKMPPPTGSKGLAGEVIFNGKNLVP